MEKLNLGLAHVGIFVTDMAVSKKFYLDVLDFNLDKEYVLKEADGDIKLVFISSGTCAIELVELPKPQKKPTGPIDHLSFSVKNIAGVRETLADRGILFDTEEITHVSDLFPNGTSWIFFKGPDGERLEINEVH